MAVCIEPMFNLGGWETTVDPDGWTVRTVDGSLSAHFEHTVAITRDGVKVMTLRNDPVAATDLVNPSEPPRLKFGQKWPVAGTILRRSSEPTDVTNFS